MARLLRAALSVTLVLLASTTLDTQTGSIDILIRGGQVLDGTGAPATRADVAIRDGRIVEVGATAGRTATRTIDAQGLMVAPGFIDLHTHSEMPLLADGKAESKVRQGVTALAEVLRVTREEAQ